MKDKSHTQPSTQQKAALFLIITLSCLTVGGLLLHGPIPQDPAYHNFADHRTLFNMSNFWNVVSNLPFILVGMIGLFRCKDRTAFQRQNGGNLHYIFFFSGVLLTGLGSSYYHLQPDNWGLFWDRLAMAFSFMVFLSLIIDTHISREIGNSLLIPSVLFGILSVLYWLVTEELGAGDLRPYAITQFLPMLIIPILIFAWKSGSIRPSDIIIIGTGYALAKVCEALDTQIYHAIALSGHSLKHLAAAMSAYWMVIMLGRYQQNISQKTR